MHDTEDAETGSQSDWRSGIRCGSSSSELCECVSFPCNRRRDRDHLAQLRRDWGAIVPVPSAAVWSRPLALCWAIYFDLMGVCRF